MQPSFDDALLAELPLAERLAVAARTVRSARLDGRVWVYFIQSGDDGPVKIGVAIDPADRLATLQQGNPTPLRLLAVYRGFPFEERQLHEEFAGERLTGEWFRPAAGLLATAEALNDDLALADFAEAPSR